MSGGQMVTAEIVQLRGGALDGQTMAIRSDVNAIEVPMQTQQLAFDNSDSNSQPPVRTAIYRRNMEAQAKGGHVFDFDGYTGGK